MQHLSKETARQVHGTKRPRLAQHWWRPAVENPRAEPRQNGNNPNENPKLSATRICDRQLDELSVSRSVSETAVRQRVSPRQKKRFAVWGRGRRKLPRNERSNGHRFIECPETAIGRDMSLFEWNRGEKAPDLFSYAGRSAARQREQGEPALSSLAPGA